MQAPSAHLWVARAVTVAAFLLFFSLLAVMFSVPVNFAAVDLGRHLENGEMLLALGAPFGTNFYSFTEPDFPVVNHHWLSGVLFYALWKVGGFVGLHGVYVALHLFTVGLFMWAARGRASHRLILLVSVLLLPLLVNRNEIRPEGLSYLALALLLNGLLRLPDYRGPMGRVWVAVAALSVLWVNSHIFFFLGWMLTGAFLLEAWLQAGRGARVLLDADTLPGRLVRVLLIQLAASLLNPWGLAGVLEPFLILREYAYTVLENQSVPFAIRRLGGGVYWHYLAAGVLTAGVVMFALRRAPARSLAAGVLLLTFYALGFQALRAMTMFALLAIPLLSVLLARLLPQAASSLGCLVLALALMLTAMIPRTTYFSPWRSPAQLGLMPGVQGAGEFIKLTGLKGPFLNNYDIGGYFIFHLFPRERPFVDNRPEAYSAAFLRDTYLALLADEKTWRQMDERYRFNAIFFYRHDATEHAQPFLIRRIADPDWVPVMVDDYNIVLARRSPQNARIIRDYALPKEMFSSRPGQ